MDDSASNANKVWRKRLPAALVAAACVAGVIVAVTGAASPLPGLQFLPVGHWVFNAAAQRAFHVDGGTDSVDASAQVSGDPGSQVVQSDTSGYVVGHDKIVQFGKSNLSVEQTSNAPAAEAPVSIEANGGPYLVYESTGQIVRLGDPPATISAGGAVTAPVVTSNGTLWVMHQETGQVCELLKGAKQINNCPATAPAGHVGALTVVADRPTLVDTTANTVQTVGDKGLGKATPLGVQVSPGTTAAPSDVGGKVALLDQHNRKMDLVDVTNPGVKPVSVPLPSGNYQGPVSTGSVVVLVNQTSNTLLTYDAGGKQQDSTPVPAPVNQTNTSDQLSKGEDSNVYLDNLDGSHVLVVAQDGKVNDVPVVAKKPGNGPKPGPGKPDTKPNPPPNNGGPVQQVDQPKKQQPNPDSNPPPVQTEKPPQKQQPVTPPSQQSAPPPVQSPPPKQNPPPTTPTNPTVPASPPGAPGSVSASPGNAKVSVSWTAADDNRSPITSYTVTVGGRSVKVGGSTRSATIAGLTNGQQYVANVVATNAKGSGAAASSAPVTPVAPVTAADAPPSLSFNTTSKLLSWGTPALNGGSLAHYSVTATGVGTTTTTGNSMSFSNLQSGTVTFSVAAVTTSGGQTFTGKSISRTYTIPPPQQSGTPQIVISRGGASDSSNCHEDCAQVLAHMTGFPPNTTVTIDLVRSDGHQIDESGVPIDDHGEAHSTGLSCDVGNQGNTIQVVTADGSVHSNTMVWE